MKVGDEIGGNYRLVELRGQGGFGRVYQAEEIWGGRATVAIKVFNQLNEDEFRLLAGLDHPNILRYRTTLRHDDNFCLVTDFADGGDAETLINDVYTDGLPAEQVLKILEGVVDGLTYLHSQNVVHRDIKPANILFVNGKVCLGDVGIAKTLEKTMASHTGFHSLAYAAPELFDDAVHLNTDIYSLGITTYQLLTGSLPFEGPPHKVMKAHLSDQAVYPSKIADGWRTLIQAMLHKDPYRRPNATDLRQRLQELLVPERPEPTRSTANGGSKVVGRVEGALATHLRNLKQSRELISLAEAYREEPPVPDDLAKHVEKCKRLFDMGSRVSKADVRKLIDIANGDWVGECMNEASYLIGDIYFEGRTPSQDADGAAPWYRMAAERGHADAQFSLGLMHSNGHGAEKNADEARKWYQLAAAQGHTYAKRLLKQM